MKKIRKVLIISTTVTILATSSYLFFIFLLETSLIIFYYLFLVILNPFFVIGTTVNLALEIKERKLRRKGGDTHDDTQGNRRNRENKHDKKKFE